MKIRSWKTNNPPEHDWETQYVLNQHNDINIQLLSTQNNSITILELQREIEFLKDQCKKYQKEIDDYRKTLTYYDAFHNYIFKYDSELLEKLLDGYMETVSDNNKDHYKFVGLEDYLNDVIIPKHDEIEWCSLHLPSENESQLYEYYVSVSNETTPRRRDELYGLVENEIKEFLDNDELLKQMKIVVIYQQDGGDNHFVIHEPTHKPGDE